MAKIVPTKNGSKRDVIIKAAASLFKEKGYVATSMRDIAVAIGVEAPSLYNHIDSKKEILKDICFKIGRSFTVHLKEVELSNENILFKMDSIIRFHIDMMMDEYENVYISDHEWRHLHEPFLTEFKNQRRNYRARLATLLQKGIDKKEISLVNANVAVLTILSAIGGIESWHRSGRKVDAKTLEENMVKILIGGLKNHLNKNTITATNNH
ncbi:MAG: TetR/AcrR family transcriptional regulator [Bacteroidota bacterium]|nr:TetR/AcrR family transcriptional regulator [Bacteroidota bacterium]